jgi:hypothetical protein
MNSTGGGGVSVGHLGGGGGGVISLLLWVVGVW